MNIEVFQIGWSSPWLKKGIVCSGSELQVMISVEYVGCHVWVKDLKMKSRSFRGRY